MATVRKRKWTHNGKDAEAWVVNYTDQGGKRRQKTFEKKKDADRWRTQVEGEIITGSHTPDRATITVAEAAQKFIADCERRRRIGDRMTGYTLSNVRVLLNHVEARFGSRKLNSLSGMEIQDWLNLLAETYARKTVAQIAARFSNVLDFAVRRGTLAKNVISVEKIAAPRAQKRPRAFPSKAEMAALLQAAYSPPAGQYQLTTVNGQLVICLGIFAGLRIGEISGLQWEDVDFEAKVLRVRHSHSYYDGLKDPKTAAGIREIPMAAQVEAALLNVAAFWDCKDALQLERQSRFGDADSRRGQNAVSEAMRKRWGRLPVHAGDAPRRSGFVLQSARLKPLYSENIRHCYFTPLMARAGLTEGGKPKFTPHGMRHAAASLFIEAGLPAMNLKAVIGHSSVSVTYDIYGHLFPEDDRTAAAVSNISSAMSAAMQQQDAISI